MTTTIGHRITDIEKLIIEGEIQRLLSTYVHYLDDGKFAEIADLMAYAEFGVMGDKATGRDEVEAFLVAGVQRHADGTPRTWHSVSNATFDIEPSGLRASSVCYFTVHQELEGFPLQPICAGRYEDTFEKLGGEWRFSTRVVRPRLFGNVSRHVGAPLDMTKV